MKTLMRRLWRERVAGYVWRTEVGRCCECSRSSNRAALIGERFVGTRRVAHKDCFGRPTREATIYTAGPLCIEHVDSLITKKEKKAA